MLVALALIGTLQVGCQWTGSQAFSGRGCFGGPDYYEGAPYYGGHHYPYSNPFTKGYYGDKDIGFPYYLCHKIMYYKLDGAYCYYMNHMRYYITELPAGGRYIPEPACCKHPDSSK